MSGCSRELATANAESGGRPGPTMNASFGDAGREVRAGVD
jgi:hypothetical protein